MVRIHNNALEYGAYTVTGELYDGFQLEKQVDGIIKWVNKIPDTPEKFD